MKTSRQLLALTLSVFVMLSGSYATAQTEIVEEFVPLIEDSFQVNSGFWDIYGGAALTGQGTMQLTAPLPNQTGIVWLKQPIRPPYHVEFQYRISTDVYSEPADAFVFMFNKKPFTEPQLDVLNNLGIEEGNGYGIEFDTYPNTDYRAFDPDYRHVALWKNTPYHYWPMNESTTLQLVEHQSMVDGNWHHVRIEVNVDGVRMFDNNELFIDWNGELDNTFNHIGFMATTGGHYSAHEIDNVVITGPDWGTNIDEVSYGGHALQRLGDSFKLDVPYVTSELTLEVELANNEATISSVTGATYSYDGTSYSLNVSGLKFGLNEVELTVKGKENYEKQYTIVINRTLDTDNNGRIDIKDIVHLLSNQVDVDASGSFDHADIVWMLQRISPWHAWADIGGD